MFWLPNPFKSLPISDDEESLPDAGGVAGGGSVKEDLSEIGETIGRQLRGVAAFLAPPPPPSPPPAVGHAVDEYSGYIRSPTNSPRLAGIRNDLAEISGSFKSSLSLISSKKAATGISKMASDFLRRNKEREEAEKDDHGVGITNEVVDFVTDISEWPECWTDFPLSVNDDGFTMTQTHAEHISTIEQIVPSLADLRITLSSDMSERKFWMIYFILLIPRLNENSLNLLSTPEVVEARNMLLTMLRNNRNSLTPGSKKDHTDYSSQPDKFNQKGRGEKLENTSDEKLVLPENSVVSTGVQNSREGTAGNSLDREDADTASGDAQRQLHNEDDISFSDLDADDTDPSSRQYGPGRGQDVGSYSSDGSSDWVRLNKHAESGGGRSRKGQLISQNRGDSEGEESSDWLTIHEFDYFN